MTPFSIDKVAEEFRRLQESVNILTMDFNLQTYDIWTEGGRSTMEQSEFKTNLIKFYNSKSWFSSKICCMATGVFQKRERVIASHIWKQSKHGVGLPKFGLQRQDATSPRNGLLLLRDIELKFDVKEVCFVYDALRANFLTKVLNPALLSVSITHSKGKTFGSINGKTLHLTKDAIPFRRLLSFHAKCSFLVAKEKGWITEEEYKRFELYHDLSDSASVPEIDSVSI
jgi:hypothetical protein